MKFSCQLSTPFSHKEIKQLFASELERQHTRSKVELKNKNSKAVFEVKSEDMTAMRASLNSLTGTLSIYARAHGKNTGNAKH